MDIQPHIDGLVEAARAAERNRVMQRVAEWVYGNPEATKTAFLSEIVSEIAMGTYGHSKDDIAANLGTLIDEREKKYAT